ncbi:hypothetical protein [Sphingomicrobium astaxanthinifaciens]|uniref:hypothetical protein n=1 Tax=Sphingomicrobium astaxanthinifaciens TaxID=1227949 RepID=UPI001FCC3B1D|nr:hypothetical protein [Sphingomicrobium astaxanthinifaciens]MCJ7421472.1 hypothetical protein [Sphingomicrobium astaxanthinifaciens]
METLHLVMLIAGMVMVASAALIYPRIAALGPQQRTIIVIVETLAGLAIMAAALYMHFTGA